MVFTQQQALEASVVVDMKQLTGLNENVARVDIDVLLTESPDTFNLFLLALEDMQKDDTLVGWFQVAGIHGRPRAIWGNDGRAAKWETWDGAPKRFDPGYCAHGVLTFAPWHRPYVALLEQSLYRRMRAIAGLYTDASVKARYLAAAQKFRLPYFDYFRPRGPGGSFRNPGVGSRVQFAYDFKLPDIFNVQQVTVLRYPDNAPKPLDNPLYAYRFQKEGEKRVEFKSEDLRELVSRPSSL
jgi:tyrosinase